MKKMKIQALPTILAIGWMCVVLCPIGYAQANSWTNILGDKWETDTNWSLGIAPGTGQSVFVTNANSKAVTIDDITSGSFPATMAISDVTVSAPSNSVNTLTLLNAGSVTPLSCGQSATVGAGGAITVMGASLIVTNAAGTGILTVGTGGQGTFALNGGIVIADQFVTTTNALLFIDYGTLTTLHGSVVNVSSTQPSFQIGNASNQPATWNVLGGTNFLLIDSYSTLDIGSASAPGIVTVSGPGTILTNTSGIWVGAMPGSSLSITNGAIVQTAGYDNALFGNNSIVVVGQGSRWDSSTSIRVDGENGRFSILDGAKVTCPSAAVGDNAYNSGNVVMVSGSNSAWSVGGLSLGPEGDNNTLIITNGGSVMCSGTTINQYNFNQSGNSIVVAGNGSTWTNGGWVYVVNAYGFTITIKDGGQASCSYFIGESEGGQVLVIGSGSVWTVSADIQLDFLNQWTVANGGLVISGGNVNVGGPNAGSQLILTNGGTLVAANLSVGGRGQLWVNHSNSLVVAGGNLVVTNASASAPLEIYSGALSLNGGTVTVDDLLIDNGTQSAVAFSAGTIYSGGATVVNSNRFIVGDGTHTATYALLGGVHSFANGLAIRSNAVLSGCGTITGVVVIDAGGIAAIDCGGTLTVTGTVTNNGSIVATNGAFLAFQGLVVNNGTIDTTAGSARFHGGIMNNGSVALDPNGDADGDGMPNGWEKAYGLNPLDPADANADPDGDGFSNLQEYLAGTDPTNGASSFRIISVAPSGIDLLVTWMTGIGRTNALQATAGDASGSYNTSSFVDIFTVTNTVGPVTNYLDIGAVTNSPSRFYRVRLVP
jgi:T5SS/PEP-CTERM-associated repeat protein